MTDWLTEWLNDWLIEWLTEWLNKWVSEWMNEWKIMIDWLVSEYVTSTRLIPKPATGNILSFFYSLTILIAYFAKRVHLMLSSHPLVHLTPHHLQEMWPPKFCIHFLFVLGTNSQIRWAHCHHGMARPQVADGGDGLQIWRVAANMLNKKS
jgi:hypothetical protein